MEKELLLFRNNVKGKKPWFRRQDSHKVKSVAERWRAPKGMHSKMRRKLRGYTKQPSIGWSSPQQVRGLTPEGYPVIIVHTEKELAEARSPVTLAGSLGLKKRVALLKKALELKIVVVNFKDPTAFIKQSEADIAKKKEEKKARATRKEKTVEATKKKVEEKAKVEETPEEKEKRELEEKKKVLEQR